LNSDHDKGLYEEGGIEFCARVVKHSVGKLNC
jgi:hypothetical protein